LEYAANWAEKVTKKHVPQDREEQEAKELINLLPEPNALHIPGSSGVLPSAHPQTSTQQTASLSVNFLSQEVTAQCNSRRREPATTSLSLPPVGRLTQFQPSQSYCSTISIWISFLQRSSKHFS
jgi:hypothetical protein